MSGKPFFFDNNMFDDEHIAIATEEEEKARAEYTKDEMVAERKKAYELGRLEGIKESEEGLSKAALNAIQKIDRDMAVLFAAEHDRSKEYEIESVQLTLSIIRKMFPLYVENNGAEELKSAIIKTISEYSAPKEIEIELHDDILQNLTKHIKNLENSLSKKITMISNNNLTHGECKITWPSGGVICNRTLISEKIFGIMKETLAEHGISVHDDENNPISNDKPKKSENNPIAGGT